MLTLLSLSPAPLSSFYQDSTTSTALTSSSIAKTDTATRCCDCSRLWSTSWLATTNTSSRATSTPLLTCPSGRGCGPCLRYVHVYVYAKMRACLCITFLFLLTEHTQTPPRRVHSTWDRFTTIASPPNSATSLNSQKSKSGTRAALIVRRPNAHCPCAHSATTRLHLDLNPLERLSMIRQQRRQRQGTDTNPTAPSGEVNQVREAVDSVAAQRSAPRARLQQEQQEQQRHDRWRAYIHKCHRTFETY